jgi:hypothetical protein
LQLYNQSTPLFKGYTTSFHAGYYGNSFIYRYAEDKLYVAPRATRAEWSNSIKGAVWTLGSGNSVATAVQTNLFDSFSKELGTGLSNISINSDGFITERIATADSYVTGQTSQVWDTSAKTQKNIAYVRQSGAVGATVNISLLEGVTSSDTLSSTYWLNKEDMYYSLDNGAVPTPAFSYLKLLSNNYAPLTAATVNATSVGSDALSITAPAGKYLIVYRYESTASNNWAVSTGVKVDGNSIATGLIPNNSSSLYSDIYGRRTSANPPHICKTFSLYRSQTAAEDAASAVYYYIGEPS